MRVVFDSSTIISISQTCLANILGGLKQEMGAEFLVPRIVFEESVKRPISIKRFELNAIRVKKAIDEKWLAVAGPVEGELPEQIGNAANNCFFVKGNPVKLLQKGEIEALALAKELGAEALAIDERTTRMLIEGPEQLRRILQARRNVKIGLEAKNASFLGKMFQDLVIVRSVELIALAYEFGLLEKELPKGRQSLEAALFAAKYNGCAVSSNEIKMFLRG